MIGTHGFDIGALDRVLRDAPIVQVFTALSGCYARLAEQVAVLETGTVRVKRRGLVRLSEEQAQSAADNGSVSRQLAERFPLAESVVARDACRLVVQLLSERSEASDAMGRRLIADLQASLATADAGAVEVAR